MKTHVRNFTVGGALVPLALVLATLIANEAQTLLGLHLERVSLAIYLLPFLAGTAAAIAALLRLEATKIGGELGHIIGDLAGSMFAGPTASTSAPPVTDRFPAATEKPPPPPLVPPRPPAP